MTKPMIRIHNVTTNEVIDREMNADEYASYLAQAEETATKSAEAEAKATARASALAKLAELGLTPDEVASL